MSVVLDYNSAETFVTEQNKLNNDVRWEGWTLVFFRKSRDNRGWNKREGAFRKDNWGFESRVTVGTDGKWRVPSRNVRNS
ncbi:hypothetical protein SEA_TOMAS_234 [Streptomyces phage Tomas]|uniref:Uncharacterized protein n=1 Tax=Streptomyces phage Tomas TaxID=2914443 RepID=A0AA49BS68_9CAUD|nr:hypothetical protein PP453_gp089 [Streptomyces phage Tomas]UMO76378.1 hypothetical protein SEA_TOMAS_234 [Streptomyces phage Tomas]